MKIHVAKFYKKKMFEEYYKYIRKEDEVKSIEDIWKTRMVFFKLDKVDDEIATAEKRIKYQHSDWA